MTNKEIREKARKQLKDNIFSSNWMYGVLVILITGLLIGVCGSIPLAGLFLVPVIIFGMNMYFLLVSRLKKENNVTIDTIFEGFKPGLYGKIIGTNLLSALFILLWSLIPVAGIFFFIQKTYSYCLVNYLICDNPNMSEEKITEAITKSKEMMDGYKWKLFCLQLSFIGWDIISILTLGIGAFWVSAYKSAAYACFYQDIVNNKKLVEVKD